MGCLLLNPFSGVADLCLNKLLTILILKKKVSSYILGIKGMGRKRKHYLQEDFLLEDVV